MLQIKQLFLISLFCIALMVLTGCQDTLQTQKESLSPNQELPTTEVRADLEKYFQDHGIKGSFILHDKNNNHTIEVNPERNKQAFIPASTFKILNSLIGLETAVISDQNHEIEWDKTVHEFSAWNQNHTLETAIQNSVVWYYQALAREVGAERMQHFVSAANYGNENIDGEIDTFWLEGELRISPIEQIDFLQRFYEEELPFSERSINIVKDIIIVEETETYRIRAKTGAGLRFEPKVGWWVGYLEENDNVYFFALNIEGEAPEDVLSDARFEITKSIMKELGLLQ